MEPEEAFDESHRRISAIVQLLSKLKESSQFAFSVGEEEETQAWRHPSRFSLERLADLLKEARDSSLKAWRLTKQLHQFVVDNETLLAFAVVERQKKRNGHPAPEAKAMEHDGGEYCVQDVCLTPEGIQILEGCCSSTTHEQECRVLWLRLKTRELTAEQYIEEIERLTGPLPDREEKLEQIRELVAQVIEPPQKPKPQNETDEDDDPEHLHDGKKCSTCDQATAVGMLGNIGEFCPQNKEWLDQAMDMAISAEVYADRLMREAVKAGNAQAIELIDEVQKQLRGEG